MKTLENVVRFIVVSIVALIALAACTPLYGQEVDPTPTPEVEKVNVNTATLDELVTLPGIGKVIAQRIIDGRDYAAIDELLNVKGIAYSKLEKIRPYITVGDVEEQEPEATPTPVYEEPKKLDD